MKISSCSKEAHANPAGIVSLSSQSSKLQANQKARSKRPGPPGEIFIHAAAMNMVLLYVQFLTQGAHNYFHMCTSISAFLSCSMLRSLTKKKCDVSDVDMKAEQFYLINNNLASSEKCVK